MRTSVHAYFYGLYFAAGVRNSLHLKIPHWLGELWYKNGTINILPCEIK